MKRLMIGGLVAALMCGLLCLSCSRVDAQTPGDRGGYAGPSQPGQGGIRLDRGTVLVVIELKHIDPAVIAMLFGGSVISSDGYGMSGGGGGWGGNSGFGGGSSGWGGSSGFGGGNSGWGGGSGFGGGNSGWSGGSGRGGGGRSRGGRW